jgi:hypothetical protein
VPEVQRGAPLVDTSSGAANTAGQARKSRLTEILWGQTLLAGSGARADHPNPPAAAPDHALLLTSAEKRLLAEWMDLGGQYYNDPFDAHGGVRTVTALSEASFPDAGAARAAGAVRRPATRPAAATRATASC